MRINEANIYSMPLMIGPLFDRQDRPGNERRDAEKKVN